MFKREFLGIEYPLVVQMAADELAGVPVPNVITDHRDMNVTEYDGGGG